jgi:alkyldihydroxyacetonephosphate synthase
MATKWWGWGEEGRTFPLPDPQRFWTFVRGRFGETGVSQRIESLDGIALRPCRLDEEALAALGKAVGDGSLTSENTDRAVHSLGKSYRDLVRIRRGEVPNPTDAVLYPRTEEQIEAILEAAARRGVAVIPFGGGTTVVGGVEPVGDRPVVTLDLKRMDRVLHVDPIAATAVVEPGITGPALETYLNNRGFTLGHFPQSFEYSTLGGWIATRSGGQKSTLYGKIEERVASLRMLFPGGVITTPCVPAAAAGPDLTQALVGSEGVLGVITQATVRLAPRPKLMNYQGYLFPTFEAGITASRELMQAGLKPSVLRLSDERETELSLALRAPPTGLRAVVEGVGRWYLARRGMQIEASTVMIVGFEGTEDEVRSAWDRAKPILRRQGGISLGRSPGRAWERSRFELPYLRDVLLDHAVMVDTLETATTWDRYLSLYRTVGEAIAEALGDRGAVMAHLSHSYSNGGSIYYTFLAPQKPGRELEQWEEAKVAATKAIVSAGGALSHHHGIGSDHRPWMGQYLGPAGLRALAALKETFDPQRIMNPGKLVAD